MEDDDEIHSHESPIPNGRITVTVAAPPPYSNPPQNTLTLALPIQQHSHKPVGGSSGGGREDCWSEEATAVLIDAWGERYLELSRGNLKQKHWKDVADIVSSREDYMKTPKTDIQCKNRIDTVKKKYKVEKAKIASGGGPSTWRFYEKIDDLIGPSSKTSNSVTRHVNNDNNMYQRVPMGIPVGSRSGSIPRPTPPLLQQKPNLRVTKRPKVEFSDEESEPEPEHSADSSDGLPPASYTKRPRVVQREFVPPNNNANTSKHRSGTKKNNGGSFETKESTWGDSMKELTLSLLKFGEAYEQAETEKLQQLVEMEKQRMKFAKELELQRMQFFMKMQLELSQLKQGRTGNENNHHGGNSNGVNNGNNNSDSSS